MSLSTVDTFIRTAERAKALFYMRRQPESSAPLVFARVATNRALQADPGHCFVLATQAHAKI